MVNELWHLKGKCNELNTIGTWEEKRKTIRPDE